MSRWWAQLREEVQAAWTRLAPPAPPEPGLYVYPLSPKGGKRRLHLRVDRDGAGVLFADVTDAAHLNATATEMAKLALDDVPPPQARAALAQRYRDVTYDELDAALAHVYALIERFRDVESGCPACAVQPLVEVAPLFSTPVSAPFKADLALTYRCNNACAHCYNEPGRKEMPSLPTEDWFRVLETLADVGVPHVILTGGEPTLHPNLPAIVRHADDLGQIVGMNSNGRALGRRPLVDALVDAGLNHVQITLESCRADVHNTLVNADAFDQTVRGVENALASGLHTITNTTLTHRNVDHALETVDFVHNLGLTTFAMNGMIYAGRGLAAPDAIPAEELAAVLVAVEARAAELGMRFLWYTVTDYCELSPVALGLAPKRCNAAEYSICVEPNGDVLPCQSYYVTAGNLLRDPWDTIWNSDLFLSFREREEHPQAAGLPETCWDCPDLEMCGGGCRLEREARARACR